MTAVLRDPMVIGLAVFVVGALVMAAVMAVTTTQRWHDRHHRQRSELMCDHCRERRRANPASAPRMRVIGERQEVAVVLAAALAGRQVVDLPAEPVDELAARVLDEHLLAGPRPGQCRCGWGDGSDVRTLGRSHSKHVVKQLRAAGALAGSGSGED